MNSTILVAFFVVGNLIGAGFFTMPKLLAPLGLSLVFSWTISLFVALVFAMIFGRLYVLFPKSSVLSDYFENVAVKKTVAMVYWGSCLLGNTFYLMIISDIFQAQFNPLLLGFLLIFVITLVQHYFNYDTIAKIEILLTFLKFFVLLILPIAFFMFKPDMFKMPCFTWDCSTTAKLGASCVFAFLGIESASVFGSGKSARNGLIIGIIACFFLYLLTSLFIIGSVSGQVLQNSSMPFAELAKVFFADKSNVVIENIIGFFIAFTVFGTLYGWVAAVSKMSLSFAKSNVFPKQFLKKTASSNSFFGLWLSSFITYLIFTMINKLDIGNQFNFILDLCVYITLLLYSMCAFVLFKHARAKKGVLDYVLSILGIIFTIVLHSFDTRISMISIASIALLFSVLRMRKISQ